MKSDGHNAGAGGSQCLLRSHSYIHYRNQVTCRFLVFGLAYTCRWVLNQCLPWLQCTSAWVNSYCLMLLAKQTVLSPCSPPPSLTYTSNTKEPASLCQETLTQAPYPLLITYSFTKSNAIMRLLSENEICSQCGSFLMEMIKWEMI